MAAEVAGSGRGMLGVLYDLQNTQRVSQMQFLLTKRGFFAALFSYLFIKWMFGAMEWEVLQNKAIQIAVTYGIWTFIYMKTAPFVADYHRKGLFIPKIRTLILRFRSE